MQRAAAALFEGAALPEQRGLTLRGREHLPVLLATLPVASPLAVAALGLLRLGRLAEDLADVLCDHPDPGVRRAAAVLAARAYPLRIGLEGAEA